MKRKFAHLLHPRPSRFLGVFALALLMLVPLVGYVRNPVAVGECPPALPGTWMAYCESKTYADYEHGALFWSLEPEAERALKAADIFILGNSRTQYAMANQTLRSGLEALGAKHHFLAFGYGEGDVFPRQLIERLGLKPRILVINADPFFDGRQSPVAKLVLAGQPLVKAAYRVKRFAYRLQADWCGSERTPAFVRRGLCEGKAKVYLRAQDGGWLTLNDNKDAKPGLVIRDEARGLERLDESEARARHFLKVSGTSPHCLILTSLPSEDATPGLSKRLAERLGAVYIDPGQRQEFLSFDRSHLTPDSALQWTSTFLDEAAPVISACLGKSP